MDKKSGTYDKSVGEKANTAFAKRLQKLITDPSDLKDYLGCSLQAINQYKLGTNHPKMENLIKIADYYGISVDYLLGRTDIPNLDTNMQSVHALTGLSVGAITCLNDLKIEGNTVFLDVISLLLEDHNMEYFLALLCSSITSAISGDGSDMVDITIGDIPARMMKKNIIDTAIQSHFIENLSSIAEKYKKQYDETPNARLKRHIGNKTRERR